MWQLSADPPRCLGAGAERCGLHASAGNPWPARVHARQTPCRQVASLHSCPFVTSLWSVERIFSWVSAQAPYQHASLSSRCARRTRPHTPPGDRQAATCAQNHGTQAAHHEVKHPGRCGHALVDVCRHLDGTRPPRCRGGQAERGIERRLLPRTRNSAHLIRCWRSPLPEAQRACTCTCNCSSCDKQAAAAAAAAPPAGWPPLLPVGRFSNSGSRLGAATNYTTLSPATSATWAAASSRRAAFATPLCRGPMCSRRVRGGGLEAVARR